MLALALVAGGTAWAERGTIAVPLADVPADARAAIEHAAGGRPILAVVARAGDHGDMVYEALIDGVDSTVDVAVDQRGRRVARFIMPRAPGVVWPLTRP